MSDKMLYEKSTKLIEALMKFFCDPNEKISNPEYWDNMATLFFLRGIEFCNIQDENFNSIF